MFHRTFLGTVRQSPFGNVHIIELHDCAAGEFEADDGVVVLGDGIKFEAQSIGPDTLRFQEDIQSTAAGLILLEARLQLDGGSLALGPLDLDELVVLGKVPIVVGKAILRLFFLLAEDRITPGYSQPGLPQLGTGIAVAQRVIQAQPHRPVHEAIASQTRQGIIYGSVQRFADSVQTISRGEAQIGQKEILDVNQIELLQFQILAGDEELRPLGHGIVDRGGPIRLVGSQSRCVDGHQTCRRPPPACPAGHAGSARGSRRRH